ncbi:hypothetical protein BFW01_g4086 [Lasiodiplodia theobromae]|nr:hypothetical protein BFW01_g4086 [Lasiodiplodia theobromae]
MFGRTDNVAVGGVVWQQQQEHCSHRPACSKRSVLHQQPCFVVRLKSGRWWRSRRNAGCKEFLELGRGWRRRERTWADRLRTTAGSQSRGWPSRRQPALRAQARAQQSGCDIWPAHRLHGPQRRRDALRPHLGAWGSWWGQISSIDVIRLELSPIRACRVLKGEPQQTPLPSHGYIDRALAATARSGGEKNLPGAVAKFSPPPSLHPSLPTIMCASEHPPNPALVPRIGYVRKQTTPLKSATPFYWSYPSSFNHGIRHFHYPSPSTTARFSSFAAQQRQAAIVNEEHQMAASRFRSGLEGIAQATAQRPSSPSASSSTTSRTSVSAASIASTSTSVSIPAATVTSSEKPSEHSPSTPSTTELTPPAVTQQDSSSSSATITAHEPRRVDDLEAALATARAQQHRLAMELEKMRMQQTNEHSHRLHHHHHHHDGSIRRPSAPAPAVPSIFSASSSHSPSKRNSAFAAMPMSSSPPRSMTLYGYGGGSSVGVESDDGCNCCCGESGSGNSNSGSSNDDDNLVTELMADAARNCERMEDRVAFQRQMAALRDRIYSQAEELSERRKDRKKWDEEKEELMKELQEREDRIKGLLEGKRDSVQG